MERDAENDMLDTGANVKADVLKVGHHGSETSTGYRFLYEVNPTYAVISVGKDNSYGHPHEEVLERLDSLQSYVLSTAKEGQMLIKLSDDIFTYKTNIVPKFIVIKNNKSVPS